MAEFKDAIQALKDGKRVVRYDWGFRDSFVFMQIPALIHKETVPIMKSLPDSVKNEFESRFIKLDSNGKNQFPNCITYTNWLAFVDSENNISSWSPSNEDIFANDWEILD